MLHDNSMAKRKWAEPWLGERQAKRKYALKKKYSLTPEQYQALVDKQDGKCAICGQVQDGQLLNVDHDHKSGRIRGLLCTACNLAIGGFRERTDWLARACAYLA